LFQVLQGCLPTAAVADDREQDCGEQQPACPDPHPYAHGHAFCGQVHVVGVAACVAVVVVVGVGLGAGAVVVAAEGSAVQELAGGGHG